MASEREQIHQPDRVVVGHCPECGEVLVILNNHGVWPWIECRCGAGGDMDWPVNKHRLEAGFIINNNSTPIVADPRTGPRSPL